MPERISSDEIKMSYDAPEFGSEYTEKHERARVAFMDLVSSPEARILGAGAEADVFTIGDNAACIKRIDGKDMMPTSKRKIKKFGKTDAAHRPYPNQPIKEAELQERAFELGVRVPKIFFVAEDSANDMSYIAMERINGVTVADVLIGKASLPENFDFEKFWNALEQAIATLHRENIYHRDLHNENVMIDNETGMPVLIDFGLAAVSYSGDEADDPYASTVYSPVYKKLAKVVLLSDELSVESWKKLLRNKAR